MGITIESLTPRTKGKFGGVWDFLLLIDNILIRGYVCERPQHKPLNYPRGIASVCDNSGPNRLLVADWDERWQQAREMIISALKEGGYA